MKIEVVVCTKNRPEKLASCVPRFKKQIPYDQFTVYEGSEHPSKPVIEHLEQEHDVTFRYVPQKLFGAVRHDSIAQSDADYICMVDDDIYLSKGWFEGLMRGFSDPNVVAMSSKLIYTGPKLLQRIFESNLKVSGGSGGASIYDRRKVLECGNFSNKIHRGEDMELELRIHAAGKKWVKNQRVKAYHPIDSISTFLRRPYANVVGWNFIMQYSKHKWRFIAERFASLLFMPSYYAIKTGDPRAFGVWFIYKWRALSCFLRGKYQR